MPSKATPRLLCLGNHEKYYPENHFRTYLKKTECGPSPRRSFCPHGFRRPIRGSSLVVRINCQECGRGLN